MVRTRYYLRGRDLSPYQNKKASRYLLELESGTVELSHSAQRMTQLKRLARLSLRKRRSTRRSWIHRDDQCLQPYSVSLFSYAGASHSLQRLVDLQKANFDPINS